MKTEFENFISNGVDESNRRIFFGRYLPSAESEDSDNFDHVSVEYIVRAIHKMSSDHPKRPIEIHMNSSGGEVASMMYLHDVIMASPCQIKFFGGGSIASAATWIMAACDERYVYKNTEILLHKLSTSLEGTVTDLEIKMDQEKAYQIFLEELYASNSRMPKAFWSEVLKRDLYLSPEEALELGLIDGIIEPRKRGSLRKTRAAGLAEEVDSQKLKKLVNKLYARAKIPMKITELLMTPIVKDLVDETLGVDNNKAVEPQNPEVPKE